MVFLTEDLVEWPEWAEEGPRWVNTVRTRFICGWDVGDRIAENAMFDTVKEALAWARARAPAVILRKREDDGAYTSYSAGDEHPDPALSAWDGSSTRRA
ncbi:MAG: hypothetical protein ACRDJ9_06445 [Dehalococcoidia bacterium]